VYNRLCVQYMGYAWCVLGGKNLKQSTVRSDVISDTVYI